MQDIAEAIGRKTIELVVDRFYEAVRIHPRLSVPFAIVDDWPAHKRLLAHFWWVSLGGSRYLEYRYEVASKHMHVGFTPALLDDWLLLFRQTIAATLEPQQAQPWLQRAELIGESLRLMHQFHSEPPAAGE